MAAKAESLSRISPAAAEATTASVTSVSMRAESIGPKHRMSAFGQVFLFENARADFSVVDIVVDVGDSIGHGYNAPLERFRAHGTCVTDDAVTNLRGEVEASAFVFHELHYTQALNVVPIQISHARIVRRNSPMSSYGRRKSLLAGVTEGSMPPIVAEGHGFGQILVQAERTRDRAGDLRHFERMREARAESDSPSGAMNTCVL